MINWKTIDTVLLDMDGTLLDLHFDDHFWCEYMPMRYAEKNGLSLEQSKAIIEPRLKQVYGKLQWYCLDYWSEMLSLDFVAIKKELTHMISFKPYADKFLDSLNKAGKTVVMITNAHRGSLTLKLDVLPMAHYFDRIISSHDYGYPKESEKFWQLLESDIDLDKSKSLFIDDNISILNAAKAFGISQLLAIRYPNSQQSAYDTGDYDAVEDYRDLIITNDYEQSTE